MDEPTGLELLQPRDRWATRQAIDQGIQRGLSASLPGLDRPAMSAVSVIAASRVRLRTSVEQTHWSSEQELVGFIDEYLAATAAMPGLQDLHDDAARDRDRLVDEFYEGRLRRQLAEIELEIGKLHAADIARLLEVRVPDQIQLAVGAAKVAFQAAETFLRLAPALGQLVAAIELVAGVRVDLARMAAGEPPDKVSNWDRLHTAAQLLVSLIPLAGQVLGAGGKASAQAVLRISARSGSTPPQVLNALGRLGALRREHGLLREAVARAGTWIRTRTAAAGMRIMTGAERAERPGSLGSHVDVGVRPEGSLPASRSLPTQPPTPVRPGQGFVLPGVGDASRAGVPQRALPPVSVRPPAVVPAVPAAYASSAGELEEAKVIAAYAPGAKQLPPKAKGVDWYQGGVETAVTVTEKVRGKPITVQEIRVTGAVWTQLHTVLDKDAATVDNIARAVVNKLHKFYDTVHNRASRPARDPSPIAPNTYRRVILENPGSLIVHIHLREAKVTKELIDAAEFARASYPSLGDLPPVTVVVTGQ